MISYDYGRVIELFANDFRIVVCGIEQEYWPHPGFTHPLKLAKVRKWWAKHFEAR